MIRVFVADDHPVVLKGVKDIINGQKDLKVVDEAYSSEEVLEKVDDGKYDVILLDLSMPKRGGLEVLYQFRQRKIRIPVLILSIFPEEQYGRRVFKSGAAGYLTKDCSPDVLVGAIRKVAAGGKYVSEQLAEILIGSLDQPALLPHEALSVREYQVMIKIAQGNTLAQIAENLSLSAKTISTYRSRIVDKMQIENNVELTHYAIKHKLIN